MSNVTFNVEDVVHELGSDDWRVIEAVAGRDNGYAECGARLFTLEECDALVAHRERVAIALNLRSQSVAAVLRWACGPAGCALELYGWLVQRRLVDVDEAADVMTATPFGREVLREVDIRNKGPGDE